jgi:hypothetical protein
MGAHWQFLVLFCHVILRVQGEAEAEADAQYPQSGGPGFNNMGSYPTSDMSNANLGPYGSVNMMPSGNVMPMGNTNMGMGNMGMGMPPFSNQPSIPDYYPQPAISSGCGSSMGFGSRPTYYQPPQPTIQQAPVQTVDSGFTMDSVEESVSVPQQIVMQPVQPFINQQMRPFTRSYSPIQGTNCMNSCRTRPAYMARPLCRPVCNQKPRCSMLRPQVDYQTVGQTTFCNPRPTRCLTNTCGWGGSGWGSSGWGSSGGGSTGWVSSGGGSSGWGSSGNGGSGYYPGGNGGSGYNPGGNEGYNPGNNEGYNPGDVSGGSGYNPGGNEGFNPGLGYDNGYQMAMPMQQMPMYNQRPMQSSGCGSMGCGMMQGMMPQQPMGMTRPAPCGSGGCGNSPVYENGGAMTLPASIQPAAPGMPDQPETILDSSDDFN